MEGVVSSTAFHTFVSQPRVWVCPLMWPYWRQAALFIMLQAGYEFEFGEAMIMFIIFTGRLLYSTVFRSRRS
jgi:hypothetical protein